MWSIPLSINSIPLSINKLLQENIYAIGTVKSWKLWKHSDSKVNSDFIWGCFSMSFTLSLWIVILCIWSLIIQLPCLISKLLLQNWWFEGIAIGNSLFLWAEQASEKHWSGHCQRKHQHTCQNLTRSACDAIFPKMKELNIKHLYLAWPVVCTEQKI